MVSEEWADRWAKSEGNGGSKSFEFARVGERNKTKSFMKTKSLKGGYRFMKLMEEKKKRKIMS